MGKHPLIFIVGTGRTGSTALSRILNMHPEVLSLNELFASLNGLQAFPTSEVTGTEFWDLVSLPNDRFDGLIRLGLKVDEFLYPRNPGRFSAESTGIPALSMMVLPHLTDDPDSLFDALAVEVPHWPRRAIAAHYESLFAFLAARCGGRVVVERSGRSLTWIPRLHELFPHAKFVHMYRDGPDCAISMSRHFGYRGHAMAREVVECAQVSDLSMLTQEHIQRLPTDLASWVTGRFDPNVVVTRTIAPAVFGRMWSDLIVEGMRYFLDVPPHARSQLGYEDLLADPARELRRLAGFAGLRADPDWLARARDLLDGSRSGTALRLPRTELSALEEQCRPGRQAIREPDR